MSNSLRKDPPAGVITYDFGLALRSRRVASLAKVENLRKAQLEQGSVWASFNSPRGGLRVCTPKCLTLCVIRATILTYGRGFYTSDRLGFGAARRKESGWRCSLSGGNHRWLRDCRLCHWAAWVRSAKT